MALPPLPKKTAIVPNKSSGAVPIPSSPASGKVRFYPDVSANAAFDCAVFKPGPQPGEPDRQQAAARHNAAKQSKPSRGTLSVPQSRPSTAAGGPPANKNDNPSHPLVGARRNGKGGGNSNRSQPQQRQGQSNNGRSRNRRDDNGRVRNGSNPKKTPGSSDRLVGPQTRYDSLPRQNTDSAVAMVSDNMQGYTATLANPKENMFRIPDSSIDATALVRSIRTFEVETFFTGSADDGKFSIAVQPKPGNIDDPSHYQSLIVDASNGWPTGKFGESSSYLQTTEKSGDPRLDSNWNTLFSQPTGLYVVSGLTQNYRLFAGDPNLEGISYGLTVQYNTTTGGFTLPPGTYLFVVQFNSNVVSTVSVNDESTALSYEVLNGNKSATFLVSATSSGKDVFIPYYNPDGVPIDTFLTQVSISPVTSEGAFSSANYGNVTMLRPVGLSLLCTFTGTEFSDGGRIATGLMRPGSLTTQFLTNNPVQGNQLQEVETLGTIPGTYNGQFKQGVYSYWLPLDKVKDIAFYTPDEANAMEYPYLVASGQLSTTGTVTSTVVATIRVEISIVYEFQTQASMWELQRCYGDDARLSMALMIFMSQPNSMQNEQHARWVKWLMSKGQQAIAFYIRNKDPIDALFRAGLLIAGI